MTFSKKRSHRSPNCYNIQEGRIFERPVNRPSRYISPIRIKNKNLCSPLKGRKTLVAAAAKEERSVDESANASIVSEGSPLKHRSRQSFPIWDFDKGISSADCVKGATISYREKRNPLASTRLSCYKPKINDNYALPHYKSVDDFLFLNSDETTSDASSNSEHDRDTDPKHKLNRPLSGDFLRDDECSKPNASGLNAAEADDNDDDTEDKVTDGTRRKFDETYGFASCGNAKSAKSLENIFEPKLYALASSPKKNRKDINMANISEKIKCMSSRTQKLFSKIYSNGNDSNADELAKPSVAERKPLAGATGTIKVTKSRRSLSYGNLPVLEDFRQTLRNFTKSDASKRNQRIKEEVVDDESLVGCARAASSQDKKEDHLHNAEDADSGILVNESGQSSIVDAEIAHRFDEAFALHRPDNLDLDFKFVRLVIEETERERCLGFSVKAIRGETISRTCGYIVAAINPGGVADR